MTKLAQKEAPPELRPPLEARITGLFSGAKISGPHRHLEAAKSDNKHSDNGPALPSRGVTSVAFLCPQCGTTDHWGSSGGLGECRRCNFTWLRRFDWRVFVDARTGHGFRTLAEFEVQTGGGL